VVDYFIEEYKNLRTPNPCVVCNKRIKFGWLLEFVKKAGCDMLATGHYARIASDSSKRQETRDPTSLYELRGAGKRQEKPINNLTNQPINYHLLRAKDTNKDQSYFLSNLNQEQLSKVLFPIGEYKKPEVREMAKKWNLPVHEKPESQEICFIKDRDYRDFLKRNIPEELFKPGNIVDGKGNVVGKHEGLINYTIGQRKGITQLGVGGREPGGKNTKHQTPNSEPLYVVGYNTEGNELVVGEDSQVYQKEMIVGDLSWINLRAKSQEPRAKGITVKIRYRHPAVSCRLVPCNSSLVTRFSEKQRAITPGQSAVFYQGDEVLGGGIIN